MKICGKCKEEKDSCEFASNVSAKDKLSNWCKKCIKDNVKRIKLEKEKGIYIPKVRKPRLTEEDRIKRNEELKRYHSNYRLDNFERIQKVKKEYRDNIKIEGIIAYGGKCSCCGESAYEFLTIEHLKGRDPNEKRLTGKKMWAKAKAENYPDKYTVLCFNCNCAKGAFGICPHQNIVTKN